MKLEITQEQAEVIIDALDMYARIGIGQFEEVFRHRSWRLEPWRSQAREHVNIAKKIVTGFNSGASNSITNTDEWNMIAYDIQQLLEAETGKNRRPWGKTEPMQWAKHKLAKIIKEG